MPSPGTSLPVSPGMPESKKEMVWRIAFRTGGRERKQARVEEAAHDDSAKEGVSPEKGEAAGKGATIKKEGQDAAEEEESTCEIRVLVKGVVAAGLTDEKLASLVIQAVKSGQAMQVMDLDADDDEEEDEDDEEGSAEGTEGEEEEEEGGGGGALKKARTTSEGGGGGEEGYGGDSSGLKLSLIGAVGAEKRQRPPNARKACCYCTLKKLACSGDLPW